jgi:zinc/manganese transport system permease protein
VAPALIALRIRRGISIINAWIIGTCVNLLSILLSYKLDFPTGYTLVFSHAVFALAVALIAPAGKSPEHTEGISRAARS